MDKFFQISEVASEQNISQKAYFAGQPVTQRPLNLAHAAKLGVYILKGLFYALEDNYCDKGLVPPQEFTAMQERLGKQPYLALQPITVNIRNCEARGRNLEFNYNNNARIVYLGQEHVLWVVDGQHRRQAMQMVHDLLREITLYHKPPRAVLRCSHSPKRSMRLAGSPLENFKSGPDLLSSGAWDAQ